MDKEFRVNLKKVHLESKESKDNIAYDSIKRSIINDELKPYTKLKEKNLSTALKISRTPIRQALLKLINDGFVEFIANKGMFVSDISLSDVIEIYNIRLVLDPFMLIVCLEINNPQTCIRMKKTVDAQERALNAGNFKECLKYDFDFHKIYLMDCNYKRLQLFVGSMSDQLERLANTTIGDEKRARDSILQHRHILEAYEQKDIDKIKDSTENHLKDIKGYYIKKLTRHF